MTVSCGRRNDVGNKRQDKLCESGVPGSKSGITKLDKIRLWPCKCSGFVINV